MKRRRTSTIFWCKIRQISRKSATRLHQRVIEKLNVSHRRRSKPCQSFQTRLARRSAASSLTSSYQDQMRMSRRITRRLRWKSSNRSMTSIWSTKKSQTWTICSKAPVAKRTRIPTNSHNQSKKKRKHLKHWGVRTSMLSSSMSYSRIWPLKTTQLTMMSGWMTMKEMLTCNLKVIYDRT